MTRFRHRTQGPPPRPYALGNPQTDSGPWSRQGPSFSHFMKSTILKLLWKPRTTRPFSAPPAQCAEVTPRDCAASGEETEGATPARSACGPKMLETREKGGALRKWLPVSRRRRAQVAHRFSGTRADSADSAARSAPAGKHSDKREGCGNYVRVTPIRAGIRGKADFIFPSNPWRWTS
jgi:hypothetical protein